MKTTCPRRFIALALMGALAASAGAVRGETSPGTIDRTVLPIHEPPAPTFTELDARTAKPPPRFDLKAPAGAPNVLVILIDDMGFGQPSTFGGPVHMPTLDRLAQGGLRYNNFHTTALCSPTRIALLTGLNGALARWREDGTRERILSRWIPYLSRLEAEVPAR